MPGLITATDITGGVDARRIAMGVLEKGVELSNLISVTTQCPVPDLVRSIPVVAGGAVSEDVEELQWTSVEGATFTYVNFNLRKDRVKLAASDEAKYKSQIGDPLAIQKTAAGAMLSNVLDKKIIKALETTPQTAVSAAKWDTVTNNPLVDISKAVDNILPYKADFIIMTPLVHAAYMANDFVKSIGQGNPAALKGAVNTVPGSNLDIFISSHLTAKSCMVGSSTGVCVALGNGPVEVRDWDSPENGAKMYQMDVFRQAVAPVFLTSTSKNASAYQVTAVIT